jgi:uncharacterized membrane protein
MRWTKIAWVVFGLAYIAFVAAMVVTYPSLPQRVASHFDFHGVPDGWMPRRSYALFLAGIGLALPWLLIAATRYLRKLPVSLVNIPNRAYWLTPERRGEVYRTVESFGLTVATGEVLLFLLLHLSVVQANLASPVRLQMSVIWIALAAFLLVIVAALASFYLHFQNVPEKTTGKRAR